ncbi:MAG TPA: nitroreductase family deazaflavin-dependent oxidoreductase [Terriglobales bacterium]|nr:nitroreductase family deazaflavin-dependent oxidoreductase [Terriglobales bacterium]
MRRATRRIASQMTDKEPVYLYLTTVGRRSGLPREIEIWFTQRDGRYYVIAEHGHSHWVQNIITNAAVRVRIGERLFSARARVIEEQAEHQLNAEVQALSRQKYGWGEGLVVELTPEVQ